jgi:pimeloyl-ACP methyl ester carboxylesterase
MSTFVLLHGAGSDGWYWHLVVPRLEAAGAMVPRPGETCAEWWDVTGHDAAFRGQAIEDGRDPDDWSPESVFVHDLSPELVAASFDHVKEQAGGFWDTPWPLAAWPDVPTRVVLCRDDRFFPPDFQRRVAQDRLGITPDEVPGGHLPALAQPDALADRLLSYL